MPTREYVTALTGYMEADKDTYDFINHYDKTLNILEAAGLKPTIINHRGMTGDIWFAYKGPSQTNFTAENSHFASHLAHVLAQIHKLGVRYWGTLDLETTGFSLSSPLISLRPCNTSYLNTTEVIQDGFQLLNLDIRKLS